MKLAIVYATRYGTTRRAAELMKDACLARGLDQTDVQTHDLTDLRTLPEAPVIVIGAPIYAGSIPKAASRFLDEHVDELMHRRVGLYLSCLYEGEQAEQQLADNFPPWLVAHSFGRYYVGGCVEPGKLRWLDRMIMKRVASVRDDVDKLRPDEIDRAAAEIMQVVK